MSSRHNAKNLLSLFNKNPNLRAAATKIASAKPAKPIYLDGLQGSASAALLSAIPMRGCGNSVFLVVENGKDEAGYFYSDLLALRGEGEVMFFPSPYRRDVKYAQIDDGNEILRTNVLSRLSLLSKKNVPASANTDNQNNDAAKAPLFIVTYPEALSVKVVNSQKLDKNLLSLGVGQSYDFSNIEKALLDMGFNRKDYVYEAGEFAVRGSILDVFSYTSEYPFRIDFFGDEIDSIRTFDVQSQLSLEKTDEAVIVPMLASAVDNDRVSFLDFLPLDTICVERNPKYIEDAIAKTYTEGFSRQAIIERSELHEDNSEANLSAERMLLRGEDFQRQSSRFRKIIFGAPKIGDAGECIRFHTQLQPLYHKNFDILCQSLGDYISKKYDVYILADNEKQHERLKAIFEQMDAAIKFTPVDIALHSGFVDDDLKACFFTDHQIFDRFHRYKLSNTHANDGKVALSIKDLSSFEPGDYVTHIDHGIGQFMGLVRVKAADNHEQEMMKLLYKNGDIVYVSIHSLNKVSKYKPREGEQPRLSRLGTGAWTQMKERTKTKIKDIARDLIRLYAERRKQKGFQFSGDTYMQHELEASFIYEDTPDQLKATRDIKTDMESPQPMDRLVCGDVGFGKTELAIRAAFKAATDGKQVAVLVPTTILCYQHYLTFKERLKEMPVTVDYLSRARSVKEVHSVCDNLSNGKIEILIGTQKLLGKNVKFKDLGLLIIDEEQKFGVATKEKLRQLKVNVDTLTLTATPIPRTLQFSLMGARDLSVLSTPPPNRYPIHTEVHTFSHEIIADAINFELSRGGQVFFVANRIASLPHIQSLIIQYVPDANVAVAHGRMAPMEMERTLTDFINGDTDVLLSTTIVENGIDIPNVNTIIIDNAQNFGLSDLHQMRGRVGRSQRKAFCYLLTPPYSTLSADSRRRLEAIESMSDLGSGIRLAMQDLDIRGAGNLLGAEQSGFIADLGYETYQKILSEAIQELKMEGDETSSSATNSVSEVASKSDATPNVSLANSGLSSLSQPTTLETDLPLYLPQEYIPGEDERVRIYRDIDSLVTDAQLSGYADKLKDRFGSLPKEVEGLLKVPVARRLAQSLHVERMVISKGMMTLFLPPGNRSDFYQSDIFGQMLDYASSHPKACRLSETNGKRRLAVSDVHSIDEAINILRDIANLHSHSEV